MSYNKITGNVQLSQQINKSIVLDLIKKYQPISRAGIAGHTKLARPTVSRLVESLIATELVTEIGRGEGSPAGGRKPTLIAFNANSYYVIGVELGISDTFAVMTNLEARVMTAIRLPTVREDRESTINFLLDVIKTLISESKVPLDKIIGIGLGIHGQTDIETGTVHFAPHLKDWHNVPIAAILEKETTLPCLVDNDIRAETLSELCLGAARGRQNVIGIHIGAGVGAGIIFDGQIYRGSGRSAGEIGHITVIEDGVLCRCGNHGCLETVASGPAIVAEAMRVIHTNPNTLMARLIDGDSNRMSIETVLAAARQNDPFAVGIIDRLCRHIGTAIASVINLFNPEMIVLMGSVAKLSELVLEPIRRVALERTRKVSTSRVEIVKGELDEQCGAVGAAILVLEQKHQRLGFVLAESPGAIQVGRSQSTPVTPGGITNRVAPAGDSAIIERPELSSTVSE